MKSDNTAAITVRLRISDYPEGWTMDPRMWEMWVIGKLKEASIPIKGTFLYSGIERGTLLRMDDPADFVVTIYKWHE